MINMMNMPITFRFSFHFTFSIVAQVNSTEFVFYNFFDLFCFELQIQFMVSTLDLIVLVFDTRLLWPFALLFFHWPFALNLLWDCTIPNPLLLFLNETQCIYSIRWLSVRVSWHGMALNVRVHETGHVLLFPVAV